MLVEAAREQMISQQVRAWEVLDDAVLTAMRRVPRERFVPGEFASVAFADTAIPIGHGEHMLAPKLVGRMLQVLQLRGDEQVLEIGTGTGYVTALLARSCQMLRSIEIHSDLATTARANLAPFDYRNVDFVTGDAFASELGGPYDVIAVTGSLPLPDRHFREHLAPGGRMFVITGRAPLMTAQLVRRGNDQDFASEDLFETSVDTLRNAPEPAAFEF
ncbi:MAG: protein-L-isoaspartate O-methyltransferase [Steroidobacteraceae bacterium]